MRQEVVLDRQFETQDDRHNTGVIPASLGWNWFSQVDDSSKGIAHVQRTIRHVIHDSRDENDGYTSALARAFAQWEFDGCEEVIGR